MVGPLLCIVIPIVLALLLGLVYRKPANLLAEWLTKYQSTKLVLAIVLMVAAGVGTFCTDRLDFSDLLFNDTGNYLRQLDRLKTDLETVHGLSGNNLQSVRSQMDEIVKGVRAPQPIEIVYIFAIAIGLCGALYLLITVYTLASENAVLGRLKGAEDRVEQLTTDNEDLQHQNNLAWRVFRQVEIIVVAKLQRIQRVVKNGIFPNNAKERMKFLKDALSPNEQLQSFVACVHCFFKREDQVAARMIVSLYLPSEQHLKVYASTDGSSANVVDSPNGKYKKYFTLESPLPMSKAVEAFNSKRTIVISECKPENFQYFSDNHTIKSMFACPIFYSTGTTLGVIFAEADTPNYFENGNEFVVLVSEIGTQIALRLSLENCMDGLFAKLEESIKKEQI